MRTLVLPILIAAILALAGCGMPQAIGRAAGQGIGEALTDDFREGWLDAAENAAALVVAACAFGEIEGRWPETREELERGAALLPETSSVALASFDYVLLAQGLDGTLQIWFREAGGADRNVSVGPEHKGSLVVFR